MKTPTTKATVKNAKVKATKPAKAGAKKLSPIEAAIQVLAKAGEPMNCKAMVEAMTAQGPVNEDAMQALLQIEWFANTLTVMLGVEEHNRLMEELGL